MISTWTNTQMYKLKLTKFKEALQMTVIKGSVNVGKTPTRNRWGEIPIFPFDFEKLQKYLGVYIRHDGKISLPQEDKIRIKLE